MFDSGGAMDIANRFEFPVGSALRWRGSPVPFSGAPGYGRERIHWRLEAPLPTGRWESEDTTMSAHSCRSGERAAVLPMKRG
jgi:hypothetical protein